jgi:hypothetical protein
VTPGDVDLALLTSAQQAGAAGLYATAHAAYIRSLARRYDASPGFPAALTGTRDKYRVAAQSAGHPRCAENIASLALGWHELLAFAEDVEAITAGERAIYWARVWKALGEVGSEQESYRKDAAPVNIYLASLRALLAAGRAHVASPDGGPPSEPGRWGWIDDRAGRETPGWEHEVTPRWRPQGDLIGWAGESDVYFESDLSYEVARRFAETAGQPLTVSKRGLHEDLHHRKLLASTGSGGRLASRRRLGGTQQTVVHLTIAGFDGDEVP